MNIELLLNTSVQNNKPVNLMVTDYSTDNEDLEAFRSRFDEIIKGAKENKPEAEIIDVDISTIKKEDSSSNSAENGKILKISNPATEKDNKVELEKLKIVNRKLYEFVSLLLLMNVNKDINPDSLKIEVNDKKIVLSGAGLDIVLDEKSLSSFTERILNGLESSIDKLIPEISSSSAVSTENPDSAKVEKANINLKDVFASLILDTVKKVISSDLSTENAAESETIAFNHIENIEAEAGTNSTVQEDGLSAQSPSVSEEINMTTDINSVKTESLEQVIKKLLYEMEADKEIGDIKIKVLNRTESDTTNIGAEKTKLVNFIKKFTSDFTGIAKHLVRDISKIINYTNVREVPQVTSSNHIIRPIRNAGFFDLGKAEFFNAASMQPVQEIKPQTIGGTEEFQIADPSINPADIISRISSGIFDENAQLVKEVQIMLKPESLGVIKIKIETVENGVSIKIQTQYSHTEEIISSNLQMLKNSLSENGVSLKDLIVLSDLNLNSKDSTGWSGFGNFMQNSPGPVFSEGTMTSNANQQNYNLSGEAQLPEDSLGSYQNPYHVDIVV